jgi:hypothetical protein
VLAEIDKPHKKFKWAAGLSVLFISLMFIAINIVYVSIICLIRRTSNSYCLQAAVIPKSELFSGIDVGARFFQLTIGKAINNPSLSIRFFNGLKAVSGIGNIILVTFTAARGK